MDLTESELAVREDCFVPIEAEEDAFDRLQASGDTGPEAISSFVEAVYSPDIVFLDTTFGDYREGHDAVVSMYQVFLSYFGNVVVEDRPTLVGVMVMRRMLVWVALAGLPAACGDGGESACTRRSWESFVWSVGTWWVPMTRGHPCSAPTTWW